MDEINITAPADSSVVGKTICPKCGEQMKFCPHCGSTFCANPDCPDNDEYHRSECRADTGD